MTVKIIACEVMREELLSIQPDGQVEYEFISMGLHLHPKKLHRELQNILDRSLGYSKIILTFGLCGGAAKNLKASATPLIIPKVHDCIPVLLGSREKYEHFSNEERGTFYLSCGWMITEKNILSEHQRILAKYGEKKAFSILSRMYDSYRRVLFIHTGCADEAVNLEQSHQIAQLLNLRHDTVQGDNAYIRKIVNGPWDEDDFIHVSPFTVIEEKLFGIC
ncbi:MAG TPA: DUF1638 domain-containing protein [Methylomusa anaerophila]|uniref:DUF1638 domain-containing protein n=1 Tax=Methylomusa anaerophila TaxID=1930071 RepID=A0A348AQP9_9FIRM|nr:DUF1638 domain-containing protein [Methylomusa anaerophila]BBB93397.1 hypothetical protein MAMMFC1_04114 [Methylomusa anaerophila]HML90345.1 DUF1638 domain-containing protein [Methylomusa anaerophila]